MSFGKQSVKYSCTALVGVNKKGELKPDADGYYTVVVGALDHYNSNGAYYPLAPAKALFEDSSSFMRRVKDGCCKAECGHPKPTPGMSNRDFINRVLTIEETRVCAHFKSFTLETQSVKGENGQPVVAIIAEVKPAGPMGPALKEALENKHENVCFSIRSLTQDFVNQSGVTIKNIKTIVTFDWVIEPGIAVAKKWHSPALEDMGSRDLLPDHLNQIEKAHSSTGVSFESSGLNLKEIRADLGWGDTETFKVNVSKTPVSSKW